MIKSIKVRLEPNNKQASKLLQFAGAARFAYNWALERQEANYKLGNKFISDNELRKQFTEYKKTNTWLYSISADVTKQAIKDACTSYKNFFNGKAKYPKFKSRKHSKLSFYQDTEKLYFLDGKVKIEKLTKSVKNNRWKLNFIKLSEKNRIPTDAKYLKPRITSDGLNWYISVSVELEDKTKKPTGDGIGIDLGIKEFCYCSDGYYYGNINKTKEVIKLEKYKLRKQKQISRKYEINKRGKQYVKTNNIIKAEKKLLKINRKLKNIRTDYIHQVSNDIIKREPRFIVLENLNIKGMLKNKHLSGAIQQQNLYKFKQLLEYKAKNNNINITEADTFYPSSKICSNCGAIKTDLKLKDRMYYCKYCGLEIDRDYNASINLYHLGCSTVSSTGIKACGVPYQTGVAKAKQGTMKQEINKKSKRLL